MFNVLSNLLLCIVIVSVFRKLKTGNKFSTEFVNTCVDLSNFIRVLINKCAGKAIFDKVEIEKPQPKKKSAFEQVFNFDEFNRRLNIRINDQYQGTLKTWSYEATNPVFLIMHKKPVLIKVYLKNGLSIITNVIIKDFEILEITELDSPFMDVVQTVQKTTVASTDANAAASTATDSTSNEENNETPTGDVVAKEKAVSIVTSYLSDDVTLALNAMANNAIAKEETTFVWTPELESNPITLEVLSDMIVTKLHFKNSTVNDDNSLTITINTEVEADNGNFDFEDDTHPENSNSDASESNTDQPIILEDDDIPEV